MNKQEELFQRITVMKELSPTAEVKFFVSTDMDDDYPYHQQEIRKVEFSDYMIYNDTIYTDWDTMRDKIMYDNDCEEEEADKLAEEVDVDGVILVTLEKY